MTGSRMNLHDELERRRYDHAIICTFNFQPDFFEDYCIDRFDSLSASNNITVVMDGGQYDGLISGPSTRWPKKANVRYLLHPVRPQGRFHPKLYLFASRERALLAVGSANLTRPGITRNAELMGVFEFERGKQEKHAPLFRAAAAFLWELEERWHSAAFRSNLGELLANAPWLGAAADADADATTLRFLHNLRTPLLEQIVQGVPSAVDHIKAVSPYFDDTPDLLDHLQDVLRPRAVTLYTQNGLTTMTQAWVGHAALCPPGGLRFCTWRDGDYAQNLHGKAIALQYGDRVRLAYGSANFTRAGLRSTPTNGNVEIMLVSDLPHRGLDLTALMDPCGTARQEPLQSAPRAPFPPVGAHNISLFEASLEDGQLTCTASAISGNAVAAVLSFADGALVRLPLAPRGNHWLAVVSPDVSARCSRRATIAYLEVSGGTTTTAGDSNRVLLINLQDVDTGQSTRRERRVREAQRSAEQFAIALTELLRSGNGDQLLSFLSHCDIPILGAARLLRQARERPSVTHVCDELRTFGVRNLVEYADVHAAAVGFCERHLARLERHAGAPLLASAQSYMHVARAVAHVLSAQTDRLLAGLEAGGILKAEDWSAHRQRLDAYLALFLRILRVLHAEWLPALLDAYGHDAVRETIGLDFESLKSFREGFLSARARVEACRAGLIRVRTFAGQLVQPFVSDSNTIHLKHWLPWAADVQRHGAALDDIAL